MAIGEKVLRANVGIYLAYPEAFADPTAPTTTELNDLFAYTTNEDAMVFNISCAVLDDYTMNMSDPDTDDSISVCDIGNVETPTFDNYDVSLDLFRDKSLTDNGVFNLAASLVQAPDRPFIAIKRIGKPQNATFVVGDSISMFGVNTDIPVDLVEDNSNVQLGARFKPSGWLLTNYTIAA